jgi:hypothetical protein
MLSLPPELRIANAAAVLEGPYGEVTQRAHQLGLSRQALYRDTQAVLQTLHGHDTQQQLQQLRDQVADLHRRLAQRQVQLDNAFLVDKDRLAAFASTAQAEGVSLPVCRRLLVPLLSKPLVEQPSKQRQPPSVAQLGRLTQEAARRSAALLAVLDTFSRGRVAQAAADEIFFGKRPCLMVIEQHSLCWVSGRLSEMGQGVPAVARSPPDHAGRGPGAGQGAGDRQPGTAAGGPAHRRGTGRPLPRPA